MTSKSYPTVAPLPHAGIAYPSKNLFFAIHASVGGNSARLSESIAIPVLFY